MRTVLTLAMLAASTAPVLADKKAEKVTFQDHVRPILREHCMACHSQGDAASGFAADDYGATLAGGAGGEVLASGDPDGSRLWKLITHDESPKMPPGDKLPEDQLAIIKKWIEGGLLENSGSKPKKMKKSAIGKVEVSADNRPQGEPAMPEQLFRQPVVSADRVGPVTALAASPWAPVVAVPWQRQVSLYHAGDLHLIGVLPYPDGAPQVVRFSRDGSLLLVAGGAGAKSGSAAVFDVKTGARLVTVGDELDAVLAADISPDLALVAIGGPKKKVRVYRTADATLAYELGKHTDWVTALEFSPDGKLIATADRAAGLLTWQAAAGNPRGDLRGHKGAITAVSWRADSKALASSSEDGEVRLWGPGGNAIKNFRAHPGGAMSVAFARDGRLATAGRDRKVTIWSADGKPVKQCGPMPEISLAAVFTAEDRRVVASDFGGAVQAFDPASGKPVGDLPANPPTLGVRLATAQARRDRLKPKVQGAAAKQTEAEKKLSAAEAAHAAFNQRLADAQKTLDAAAKNAEGMQAARKQRTASAAKLEEAVAAAAAVREAAEQALGVARERLAANATGPVVQSLEQAVAHAKGDEAARRKASEAAVAERQAAEKAVAAALAARGKAEQTLAQVSNQRQGLPDMTAAGAAADQARAAADKLRKRLAEAAGQVQSLTAEQALFRRAAEDWAKQVDQLTAERSRIAEQLATAVASQQAADGAMSKQQAAIDQVAKQIAAMQKELNALRSASEQTAAQTAELQRQLADAEAAAEAAEARRRDFVEAQQVRSQLLKE